MASLSLCMIVKDEEFFLDQCLAAVAPYVDEMVVVDTGSTDRTIDIARCHDARVFDFEWVEDFAKARNYSLAQARSDWILVLDADEVIAPADLKAIRQLLVDSPVDAYLLHQRNYSDNQLEKGWTPVPGGEPEARDYSGYLPNPIYRLFRNSEDIRFHGAVHEIIDPALVHKRTEVLDVPIHHYIDQNPDRARGQRQQRYLAMMERELARNPDGRLCSIAAATAMYEGELAKAITLYEQAIALGYDIQKSREGLAEAHYRAGNLAQAWDLYSELTNSGYATPSHCLNQANLAVKRGELGQALDLLVTCLDLGGLGEQVNQQIRHNIEHLRRKL